MRPVCLASIPSSEASPLVDFLTNNAQIQPGEEYGAKTKVYTTGIGVHVVKDALMKKFHVE